ncbi:hypothetical protein HaLaN_20867, partial [Haematococcus lacustris]
EAVSANRLGRPCLGWLCLAGGAGVVSCLGHQLNSTGRRGASPDRWPGGLPTVPPLVTGLENVHSVELTCLVRNLSMVTTLPSSLSVGQITL